MNLTFDPMTLPGLFALAFGAVIAALVVISAFSALVWIKDTFILQVYEGTIAHIPNILGEERITYKTAGIHFGFWRGRTIRHLIYPFHYAVEVVASTTDNCSVRLKLVAEYTFVPLNLSDEAVQTAKVCIGEDLNTLGHSMIEAHTIAEFHHINVKPEDRQAMQDRLIPVFKVTEIKSYKFFA